MPKSSTPARRGIAVQQIRKMMPGHVVQEIERHIHLLRDRPTGGLLGDLTSLFDRPIIDAWVHGGAYPSDDAKAAITSCFLQRVWETAPGLMADYIQRMLPLVAKVVRPTMGVFRLSADREFRAALSARDPDKMSLLVPLAVFFFQAVAKAQFAWDVLVDPSEAPRRNQPFGWAPDKDNLTWMIRFLLLGQCGNRFRGNALAYSPLARYLLHEGIIQRVEVWRTVCPACGHHGATDTCPNCCQATRVEVRQWLLSKAYLALCRFQTLPGTRLAVVLDEHGQAQKAERMQEASRDLRTQRQTAGPQENAELLRMKQLARKAAQLLLAKLLARDEDSLKYLILWAEAAGLADPFVLLAGLPSADDSIVDALMEAMVLSRVSNRSERLLRMNRWLVEFAARLKIASVVPFNSNQMGASLRRLRLRFLEIFREIAEGDE